MIGGVSEQDVIKFEEEKIINPLFRKLFSEPLPNKAILQLIKESQYDTKNFADMVGINIDNIVNKEGILDNGAFLSGWLYRIAYRIFIDWLRKTSRANCSTPYEESVFADDAPWRSSGAGALESREFRRPTGGAFGMSEPQESAMKSEESANLWRIARDTLTRDEFQVLWHKYVDDFDDAQVARAMGKSSGAVRSCAHRARIKLAEKLKKTL